MLYDSSLYYKKIAEDEFNADLCNLETDEAELVSKIIYFYKNIENGNILKLVYSKSNDERKEHDLTKYQLLVKYYVSYVEIHNQSIIDIADLEYEKNYKIYNVGCFLISNLIDRSNYPIQEDIKKLFEEYDLNFKNYKLPAEDEFINDNNYKSKSLLEKNINQI